MESLKRVLVESPFKGENGSITKRNILYARLCVVNSLSRDEAPFASHLFYTQTGILNDKISKERIKGLRAGLKWAESAELSAFYIDFGYSEGMIYGKKDAIENQRPIEERSLGTKEEVLRMIEELSKEEQFNQTGILF